MSFKVINLVLLASLGAGSLEGQSFGSAVVSGPREILVGEPINQYSPGLVNIFRLENGQWRKVAALTAPEGHALDRFGRSLDMAGDRLLVGATSIDDSTRGGAFLYERDRSGTWQLVTKLTPAGIGAGDAYGRAVRLNQDEAYVVSWGANQGRGSISMWRRGANGQWTEAPAITASDGQQGNFFGSSISISGNTMVVGAAQKDTSRGSVYVFSREQPSGLWVEQARFRPADMPAGASFGI